jgi:hypothetical protein
MNYSSNIYCFFALIFFSSGTMQSAQSDLGEECYFKSRKDDSRAAFRRDLVQRSRAKREACQAKIDGPTRNIEDIRAHAQPDRRYSSIDYASRKMSRGKALPAIGGGVMPKTQSQVWCPNLCALVEEDAVMHNEREYAWEAAVIAALREKVGADKK